MKSKILKLSSSIFVISYLLFSASLAMASEKGYLEQVKMKQLGGEPAILNTNPFYSSKTWLTNIKGIFISNPLSKLQFYLQTANQKASELLKLSQIAPDNQTAILKAVSDYQKSVINVNPAINKFIESDSAIFSWEPLARTQMTHLEFVDDLLTNGQSNAVKAVLVDVRDVLLKNQLRLLSGLGKTQIWVDEISEENLNAEMGFRDLRIAERLSDLSSKADALGYLKDAKILQDGSKKILNRIAIGIWMRLADADSEVIADLERLSGSPEGRIASIETMLELQPDLEDNVGFYELIETLSAR